MLCEWVSKVRFEKRSTRPQCVLFLVPLLSVIVGLSFVGLFIGTTGKSPFYIYSLMFEGAFGSAYGLSETVVKSIPLMLTGLAVALAFRMQLWNIGAEGQLYMGACGATWLALNFPHWPAYLLLPGMFIISFITGGMWGLLPAIPRAYFKVNETITTLLLNYVGILWVDYLVYGPWRDPKGFNFPMTAPFSENAILPALADSRIHVGLILAILAAVMLYIVLHYTK